MEAAIGIEPMNKGFAVLKGLFSLVLEGAVTCVSIDDSDISNVRLFTTILGSFVCL
jgi:hypothetical protein